MSSEKYIEAHKKRLEWMPWLFYSLKEAHLKWALPWQHDIQQNLIETETVTLGKNCFVAPSAALFAEPGRAITVGSGTSIGAHVFMHGPLTIGDNVSLNPRVTIDGGARGVVIGDNTRIATGVSIFAFNHGIETSRLIREQPVTSKGIIIGADVWIGANACIRDGVTIGDGAVVGMGSVVTKDVASKTVVAGNPARVVKHR